MVADASLIAAIVFNEPDRARAEATLGTSDLDEPLLLAFELTHIACTKARAMPSARPVLEVGLADALRLATRWLPVDSPAVMRLALETGLTAYDASYLWLARALRTPLATFDPRLRTAAASQGVTLA